MLALTPLFCGIAMSTDQKKEEENDLVRWASHQIEELKPYAQTILGVLVLLVLGLLLLSFMSNRRSARRQGSWKDYYSAVYSGDVDELENVANAYSDTPAGAWAMQSAGDKILARGTNKQHIDRSGATEDFKNAKRFYEVASKQANSELLRQRSLLGLAQAYEALDEFEEAKAQYTKVADKWPDTSVSKLAKRRIDFLSRPGTQEFYKWFLAQKPYTPPTGNSLGSPGANAETLQIGDITAPDQSTFPGGLLDNSPDSPPAEISEDDALEIDDAPDAGDVDTDAPATNDGPVPEDAAQAAESTVPLGTGDSVPVTPETTEVPVAEPVTESPAVESPAVELPTETPAVPVEQ